MRKTLLLLLIASYARADCDVPQALTTLRPGAQWTLSGLTYSGLNWIDATQTKPTKQEILDAISACQTAQVTRQAQKVQARLDVKNTGLTVQQRLQALLILQDLDQ